MNRFFFGHLGEAQQAVNTKLTYHLVDMVNMLANGSTFSRHGAMSALISNIHSFFKISAGDAWYWACSVTRLMSSKSDPKQKNLQDVKPKH